MQAARVVFFVPEIPALTGSVLHATLLAEASLVKQLGGECLFVGNEHSELTATKAVSFIESEFGVRAIVTRHKASRFGAVGYYYLAKRVMRQTWGEIIKFSPTHVVSRSFITQMVTRPFSRKIGANSVFSIRGAVSEEVKMRKGAGVIFNVVRYFEKREICKAHQVSVVSNKLSQYIPRTDAHMIPCCVNQDRFYRDLDARRRIRRELMVNHQDIVIVYSGGLFPWQRIDDIVDLLSRVLDISDRIHVLFLTRNTSHLKKILNESHADLSRCYLRSCSSSEVYQYLSAGDAGIILRHDTIVNNVASPIKVAEYLACGLPVIMTSGIGDYSEMLPQAGVALLVDGGNASASKIVEYLLHQNLEEVSRRAISYVESNLVWPRYKDEISLMYSVKQN